MEDNPGQLHGVLKRESASDKDGNDGNERKPKAQRANRSLDTPTLACPYFKHDPDEYGQPEWLRCVYPGYETIHRLEEHIHLKHVLLDYQCERCHKDLKSVKELEEHLKQMPACTPSIEKHDGLSREQVKRMKNVIGTRNKTEAEKWIAIYGIAFPDDKNAPSPYLSRSDKDVAGTEINKIEDEGRFLARELSQQLTRKLSRNGRLMSDTARDGVEQVTQRSIHELTVSFLDTWFDCVPGSL